MLADKVSYEKIMRYNKSPPYMTARWPPQQILPLNCLGSCGIVQDYGLLDCEISPAAANMFVSMGKILSFNCLVDMRVTLKFLRL